MTTRLETLHNRIDLVNIPFTERGSRLVIGCDGDRLYVRLAERWEQFGGSLRGFRQRLPIVRHVAFLPVGGAAPAITTESYPHAFSVTSTLGAFRWVFLDPDTLLIRLPAGEYRVAFEVDARTAQVDERGVVLRGNRNLAFTTNARVVANHLERISDADTFQVELTLAAHEGQALLINITPGRGFNRAIPDPEAAIRAAEMRWRAWLDAPPPVAEAYAEQYTYAWWVMGAGLLNQRDFFTREALVPSKLHYIGVWLWDQSFHAIAYRYVNARLAEDQLRIMLDHQQPDGMLPDAVHDEGAVVAIQQPIAGTVTKPPILAWAALKLYEQSGNLDFLAEIYEGVVRNHAWWVRDNLNPCGLCEYHHPFSSGLDDSPLWDGRRPVVAADLNTYLAVQLDDLSRMAALLGREADAQRYRDEATSWVERMIAVLWNEDAGYFDFLYEGQRIPVLTPFSLLPLWTGRLPAAINARLVAHLTNPATFWTEYAVPTVALNDPDFDAKQMWRGPTWPNINLLFVEGLEKIGERALASELRRKTLRMMQRHRDIYEYYDPLTAERPPKAAPIFGWSSATFVELAIQESAHRG